MYLKRVAFETNGMQLEKTALRMKRVANEI